MKTSCILPQKYLSVLRVLNRIHLREILEENFNDFSTMATLLAGMYIFKEYNAFHLISLPFHFYQSRNFCIKSAVLATFTTWCSTSLSTRKL
jgi:hypothetical protein